MDQLTAEEDCNKFYQVFCGAVVDQFAAMDAILISKEPFALQIMMFSCWKMSLGTYLLITGVQATSISFGWSYPKKFRNFGLSIYMW
ncbi:hypothetical protein ACSBR1_032661 [Camellia fascicularis]